MIDTEKILKAKGLEYPCVIWSSRALADTTQEQQEFIYTVFTRTSAILIIAVFDNLDLRLKEITKMFSRSRSMYWDNETEEHMASIGADTSTYVEESDADDSEDVEAADSPEDSLEQYLAE